MTEEEHPLTGGNASGRVVRVGDTVRKTWLPSTPALQTYLNSLLSQGIDLPRPLGRDAQGRAVSEFVPGRLAQEFHPLSAGALGRIGTLVRSIHDASATVPVTTSDKWDVLIPVPSSLNSDPLLICHNDLAPWNLLIGDRWLFIDWDGAGPSTRLWDLAYSAQACALLVAGEDPAAAGARLRAFVDGYRADQSLRTALPETMAVRAEAMFALLRDANASGRQPWASMYHAGHGEHWRQAAGYLRRHQRTWAQALRRRDQPT